MDTYVRMIEYNHHEYKVRYLLKWTAGESDCLSEIVYLLKSRWSKLAWHYYANIFSKLLHFEKAKSAVCCIPIPSSQRQKESYHTRYFSYFFSLFNNCDQIPCLRSQSDFQSQKSLNLGARAGVQFEIREEFTSSLFKYDQIILIDDIITSGNTITACIETLKPHLSQDCKIDIIALFSREKI
jgi:predicted amidophosphoribosyltransferase